MRSAQLEATSTPSTTDACPYCGEPLRTFSIPSLNGEPTHHMTLECECEGAVAARRASLRADRSAMLHKAWERTGVPWRYRGVSPDYESLPLLEGGRGVYIWGSRGAGKTSSACAILKAYVSRNTDEQGWCSARFISAIDWLDEIQDCYGRWGTSAEAITKRALDPQVLVVDDFGKCASKVTPWTSGKMFRLVNTRYSEGRSTIFTSRFKLSEVAHRFEVDDPEIGGDMVSRIAEMCVPVVMDGPDLRRMG